MSVEFIGKLERAAELADENGFVITLHRLGFQIRKSVKGGDGQWHHVQQFVGFLDFDLAKVDVVKMRMQEMNRMLCEKGL